MVEKEISISNFQCQRKWYLWEDLKDPKERRDPPSPPPELDLPLPMRPDDILAFNQVRIVCVERQTEQTAYEKIGNMCVDDKKAIILWYAECGSIHIYIHTFTHHSFHTKSLLVAVGHNKAPTIMTPPLFLQAHV